MSKENIEEENIEDSISEEEEKPSSYFDDDEEMLKGDDKTIHEEDDIAVFQQLENVVSWEIDNYYKENGKPKNRFSMRSDPPILRISDNSGESASFILSKDFAASLSKLLGDVERSYYGVSEKRNSAVKNDTDRFNSMIGFVKNHAILFSLVGLILIISLIATML